MYYLEYFHYLLSKSYSLFEDPTIINPDGDSLMAVSDLQLPAKTIPPQQEIHNKWPRSLPCSVYVRATLVSNSSGFRMGDTPLPLPPSCLQPIHMQLAADSESMVLHAVWVSMKETVSYSAGRQQGCLLSLRAVRRGREPFSSNLSSARS